MEVSLWVRATRSTPSWASVMVGWVPGSLRSWWHYQVEMYQVSRSINSPHDYQTTPWVWIIQGRPTSFFYEGPKRGEWGCEVEVCSRAITSLGTPTIWWAGALMLPVLVYMWLLARDWRAGALVAGYAGGYLPWFVFADRTIYTFYAVAFEPWVVLAVTFVIGLWVGRREDDPARWQRRWLVVGGYLLLTLALFAGGIYGTVIGGISLESGGGPLALILGIVAILISLIVATSITIVAPGMTSVRQFFGGYVGTVRATGLVLI